MTTKAIDVPTLTDRLRDNAISAGVDAITAAMCVDAADYIDALEADMCAAALRAPVEPVGWRDIESAPKDRWIIVYAAPAHGLPGFVTPCLWHPDGGFCVDELRNATLWQDLPAAPPTPQEPTD